MITPADLDRLQNLALRLAHAEAIFEMRKTAADIADIYGFAGAVVTPTKAERYRREAFDRFVNEVHRLKEIALQDEPTTKTSSSPLEMENAAGVESAAFESTL